VSLPVGAEPERHLDRDRTAFQLTEQTFTESRLPLVDKLEAFPRFATKRSIARFLVKYELYQRVLGVNGSIVECGVLNGAGLFAWAQLANIFEPVNHTRKVIGFDTFEGFPGVSEADAAVSGSQASAGDLTGDSLPALTASVEKLDAERALGHIPIVDLVAGDFMTTCDAYLDANPHLIVALLYLDFDLYEPTKHALDRLLPRMPRGALVCFDELNCASYPGETRAFLEEPRLREATLARFPTDPWISYVTL